MASETVSIIDLNQGYILITLLLLVSILLLFNVYSGVKLARLQKKYSNFMKGSDKESLEKLIIEIKNHTAKLQDESETLNKRIDKVENMCFSSLRGWGLIRFNAFQETGSDLSFSAAVVDGEVNGFVITSIYGREESRIYAKPLTDGQSSYKLSKEEELALQNAKKRMKQNATI